MARPAGAPLVTPRPATRTAQPAAQPAPSTEPVSSPTNEQPGRPMSYEEARARQLRALQQQAPEEPQD